MTVSLSNLSNLSDLARKRVAVAAYYFVPGVVFASWASRIPDVKQMLHLSNGQLGTVLFAIPIGQLLMMAFSGILVSRFGSKKMLVLSEVLYVLVLFCIGSSTTVFHLILSLIAFGMMANLMNIATNTQACLVEKMYGRNIMSSFHGLWSLGGFSGGIIGAIFANTLLPIDVHFGTILALSILIVAVGFRFLINDAMAKAEEEDVPKFSFKTIDPILFLLGLMGFAGMFCEGTVYDWSSVYFSSVVKPDEAFIRAGYVAVLDGAIIKTEKETKPIAEKAILIAKETVSTKKTAKAERTGNTGRIELPLCLNPLDRPRQMVSSEHGKKAITEYQIISESERITSESENTFNESNRIDESERSINESRKYTRIVFYPLTGRTHQLRVHAAHPEGLGCPILGDELYGKKADRLYLHAEYIEFRHPIYGDILCIQKEADFHKKI